MIRRHAWSALLAVCLAAAACSLAAPTERTLHHPASGLDAYHVVDREAESLIVLLHGYGARPQQWFPFTETIVAGAPLRFVFPRAPETTRPPDGPTGGRAWWHLDLASYRRDAGSLPDLSAARPPGLGEAARRVRLLIGELQTRYDVAGNRIVLGGYSQGAMVAAAVAFTTDAPLGALVLLSPTPVDLERWTHGMPARRELPVFVSHGRYDGILPFTGTERFVAAMRARGLTVSWVPFDGIHEVPALVVMRLSAFLTQSGAAGADAAAAGTRP